MAKRRWTVVLVPHGSDPSKIVEVSYAALKLLAGAAVAVLVLFLLVGFSTVARSVDLSRAARLEQENARLAAELAELDGRMEALTDTIARIAEHDARVRLLANLEPIDPEVQAAGIGGPAPATPPGGEPTALLRTASAAAVDLDALIRRATLLAHSFREATDSLASQTRRLEAVPSIMPTRGWLTSQFSRSRFHPILHRSRAHEGIDVVAPMGAPIEAPGAGVVREAGSKPGFGLTLVIDHGYGIQTRFAHASKLLVRPGSRVKRGERIALVGNSGLATGPHLHYEVHVGGRPVDPLKYVLPEVITE
jgi:murein DD-endopeptidase MepM/ murein hydrolase activator NlpD